MLNRAREEGPGGPVLRGPVLVAVNCTLAIAFISFLIHIRFYGFLTDDAFISFRYAQNLSDGHGLVFNPGFERVEGYTNFLWVLILAVLSRLGVSPETAAPALSVWLSVAMFGLIAWFGFYSRATRQRWLAITLAPVLLAATRSVAVWGTSGLETRLFELLVLAAALRLAVELRRLDQNGPGTWPLAALLFALATWTRPDGLLITACAVGAGFSTRLRRLPLQLRWLGTSAAVYALLIGGHFAFRLAYYGAWLPNTYTAKVGGQLGWEMGFQYLAEFALEYGIYLWIPFLAAGLVAYWRRDGASVPLIFLAICLPHSLYVASVGGDHFEYRPLDLYFPFAYLMMAAGADFLSRGKRTTALVVAWCVILLASIVDLPYQSHRQFPRSYMSGYPGTANDPGRAGFLEPSRGWLHRLPGLRTVAAQHQKLIRNLSDHFVGLRQEEHSLFLRTVMDEGARLGSLVSEGKFPADTHIAICCVGAIPYFSGLRTLDRHGLTDAEVAHSDFRSRVMAHGKFATMKYAERRRVDLWSVDTVHLIFRGSDPAFLPRLLNTHRVGLGAYFADVGDGYYLLAIPPLGIDHLRSRFPALEFTSTRETEAVMELARSLGASVVLEPGDASGRNR